MAKTTGKKAPKTAADFIVPLNMNGMQGRMLRMPAPKNRNREILLIYGHHALLERWWGLVQNCNMYGAVTMPDLPGFGGMDSFYKIGKKPTLDNFADYLAAFIKMKYRNRRITILGVSFGFIIATRMLQKYPELTKKVDFLVSAVGFMHYDDFLFSPMRRRIYRAASGLISTRVMAWIFRYVALNERVIRLAYSKTPNAKHKFAEVAAEPEKFQEMMDREVQLWHDNDVRTHMKTTHEFLGLDNCQKQIDLPVWHVASKNDHYFDNHIVEQHMRVVFNEYNVAFVNIKSHAPSILADKKGSAILIPPALRRALQKQ